MLPSFNLFGTILFGVLVLIGFIVRAYIAKKKIDVPASAQDWLDKLGFDVLYAAYVKAQADAKTADAQRDIAVAYLTAAAKSTLGLDIPTSVAGFLYEFIVSLVASKGITAVKKLAAGKTSATVKLPKGA